MNWINNVVRPKIRDFWRKREMPDNLWVKCPETGQMIFHKDLEANQYVVPGSGYHMRIPAVARLKSIFDGGVYEEIAVPDVPTDPLKFRDERRYVDRLKDARTKTGLRDAVLVGAGTLDQQPVVAAVQDFSFMGGSLGMAAGEAVIAGMMGAVERRTPFIMFAASGGARMQEGILSLMQMPRTTVAVERLAEAHLPYIVVLTHPTTGGVTASYAMLGDIHIAEPGALIGFAGPRVIEQTIREKLPEGFQRAEYLLDHGMVDMVVHRHQLRATLSRLCRLLMAGTHAAKHTDAAQPTGLIAAPDAIAPSNPEMTPERKSEARQLDAPITIQEAEADGNIAAEPKGTPKQDKDDRQESVSAQPQQTELAGKADGEEAGVQRSPDKASSAEARRKANGAAESMAADPVTGDEAETPALLDSKGGADDAPGQMQEQNGLAPPDK